MPRHHSRLDPAGTGSFWDRFRSGVEVAVASDAADELLGVREGCTRYFREGPGLDVPVVVVPHPWEEERRGLCLSDGHTVERAEQRARRLAEQLGDQYHLYIGTEGGVHNVEVAGETRYFVRSWTVVLGGAGEALGSSGSVEIPRRLLTGLDQHQIHSALPGTRRGGGMIHSLTGGIETRRTVVAESTLHALASLFYGTLGRIRAR